MYVCVYVCLAQWLSLQCAKLAVTGLSTDLCSRSALLPELLKAYVHNTCEHWQKLAWEAVAPTSSSYRSTRLQCCCSQRLLAQHATVISQVACCITFVWTHLNYELVRRRGFLCRYIHTLSRMNIHTSTWTNCGASDVVFMYAIAVLYALVALMLLQRVALQTTLHRNRTKSYGDTKQ
jgi:hypothetical protein